MMPWSKLALALTLLAAALIGGVWLSGFVLLHWLELSNVPLQWTTYWAYLNARNLPGFASYATTIDLSGAVGFGVPMLAWLGLVVPLFKTPQDAMLQYDAPVTRKVTPSYYEAAERARVEALSRDQGEVQMHKSLQRAAAIAGLAMTAVTATSCATQASTHHAAQAKPSDKVQQRAKFLLERLLVLIEQSKSIKDFTPEHIGEVFGVRLRSYGATEFGYSERISPDWAWNIDRIDPDFGDPMRWDFHFSSPIGKTPSMTMVCTPGYDEFVAQLKSMGFEGGPHYVEHGRVLYGAFGRNGMSVRVEPRGNGERRCVGLVQVL